MINDLQALKTALYVCYLLTHIYHGIVIRLISQPWKEIYFVRMVIYNCFGDSLEFNNQPYDIFCKLH